MFAILRRTPEWGRIAIPHVRYFAEVSRCNRFHRKIAIFRSSYSALFCLPPKNSKHPVSLFPPPGRQRPQTQTRTQTRQRRCKRECKHGGADASTTAGAEARTQTRQRRRKRECKLGSADASANAGTESQERPQTQARTREQKHRRRGADHLRAPGCVRT